MVCQCKLSKRNGRMDAKHIGVPVSGRNLEGAEEKGSSLSTNVWYK